MSRKLTESLDYRDFVDMIIPIITVDEYESKMGEDDEIATVTFLVKGKHIGEDLVDWLERGYDFVLDAEVSEGEISNGRYLVFIEMDRRTKIPERIVEMIEDLETLTDLPLDKWSIMIDDEKYPIDISLLKQKIILSPQRYRELKGKDLNEMRELSGLEPAKLHKKPDSLLKDYIAKAGI